MTDVSLAEGPTGNVSFFQEASNCNISGGNFIAAQAGRDVNITVLSSTVDHSDADWVLTLFPKSNFRKIQADTLQKRVPNSGVWFIKRQDLQAWFHGLSDFAKIIWLIGDAGTGKSILSSIVIAELETIERPSSETEAGIALAYIYCRYSESMTVEDLLLALARQQLERNPSLAPLIAPLLNKLRRENSSPSRTELLDLLRNISKQFKTTFYVIDALDEAPPELQPDIVEALTSIDARFFITSRPLEPLDPALPVLLVTLTAQKSDIELLVDATLSRHPRLRRLVDQHQMRGEIADTVYDKCGGIFLHAALQAEALRQCIHVDGIRKALNSFPAEIGVFFTQCLKRALDQPEELAQIVKQALLWILFARKGLTIEDLQHALSFDPELRRFSPTRIVSADVLIPLFCGLVTVDTESKLVRLIHYTAMDFIKDGLAADPMYLDPHELLATTCIAQLVDSGLQRHDMVQNIEQWTDSTGPLLHYAYNSWSYHVHQSTTPAVHELCTDFLAHCHTYPVRQCDGTFTGLAGIHLAALHNFPDLVTHFLDAQDSDHPPGNIRFAPLSSGSKGPCSETPLWLAAARGNTEVVRQLLSIPGIDVNAGNQIQYPSPLMVASRNGHIEVVRLLLGASGIMVNQVGGDGDSALGLAAANGREEIVRLLLDVPEIMVNQANKDGRTPLMRAALKGEEGVVRLLLGVQGIMPNQVDNQGCLALMLAAFHGQEGTVHILLTVSEAMVNHVDEDGWSALVAAAQNGHEGVVRIVLGVPGIMVNHANKKGLSALIQASRNGHKGVVRLLLDAPGIMVNQADNQGRTSLMHAALTGEEEVVCLLLKAQGIMPNQVDNQGRMALMLAALHGREETVRILLTVSGTMVNHVDEDGWSALISAAQNGHEGVVRTFLSVPGIMVNHANKDRLSALIQASRNGHEGVVRLLVDAPGIAVNQTDDQGCSPLMGASWNGQEGVVRILLGAPEIMVNFVDDEGWSPLIAASHSGHEGIVGLLLGTPEIAVNHTNLKGSSALIEASRGGHQGVIRLLLGAAGIAVNQGTQEYGDSALMFAAMEGDEDIVRLLLSASGVDVNQVDSDGDSGLIVASMNGHSGVVALFLGAADIEVNRANSHGSSSLTIAAEHGHTDIVQQLLLHPHINVHQIDGDGDSSMLMASRNNHHAIVELLLAFEAQRAAPRITLGPERGCSRSSSEEAPRTNTHQDGEGALDALPFTPVSDDTPIITVKQVEGTADVDGPTLGIAPEDDNILLIPELGGNAESSRRANFAARVRRTPSPLGFLKPLLRRFMPSTHRD